jgi:hypothetical protein
LYTPRCQVARYVGGSPVAIAALEALYPQRGAALGFRHRVSGSHFVQQA